MSIATLKRKTQSKYNASLSNNESTFSLVGTRRNQGYIGQDNLGRTNVYTVMKDNIVHGHGGNNGEYPSNNINACVSSMNNPKILKSQTLNTKGLLANKRYKYKDENNNTVSAIVKPDSNQNNNTAWSHTLKKKKEALIIDSSDCQIHPHEPACGDNIFTHVIRYNLDHLNSCELLSSNYKKFPISRARTIGITKDLQKSAGQTYSTYLEKKTGDCFNRTNNVYTVTNIAPVNIATCG